MKHPTSRCTTNKHQAAPLPGKLAVAHYHTLLIKFFAECLDSGPGLSHSFDAWKNIWTLFTCDIFTIYALYLFLSRQSTEDARTRRCAAIGDTRCRKRHAF
jgi:hypothetical protein